MDMGNIIATMRYLEDLGLQVIMASPGENLGTLTAFLDRYFDILRDPDRNVIRVQGHDVSEQTRAMFREDLPEFNPALVRLHMVTVPAMSASKLGSPSRTSRRRNFWRRRMARRSADAVALPFSSRK
jgi:hypothetical protein